MKTPFSTLLALASLLSLSVPSVNAGDKSIYKLDVYKRNQWKANKVALGKSKTAKRATISPQCSSDAMCKTASKPYCVTGQCVTCLSDSNCGATKGGIYCTAENTCSTKPSKCDGDDDCSSGNTCSNAGTCSVSQTCRTNAQCRTSYLQTGNYKCSLPSGIAFGQTGTCAYTVDQTTNPSGNRYTYSNCIADTVATVPLGQGKKGTDYFTSTTMTVSACTQFCESNKYALAGVQNGDSCYCGNAYDSRVVTPGVCDIACENASSQLCGGLNGVAIYQNAGK